MYISIYQWDDDLVPVCFETFKWKMIFVEKHLENVFIRDLYSFAVIHHPVQYVKVNLDQLVYQKVLI